MDGWMDVWTRTGFNLITTTLTFDEYSCPDIIPHDDRKALCVGSTPVATHTGTTNRSGLRNLLF